MRRPVSGGELRINHSFSIITTDANALMKPLHDRMPVIIERKDEDAWFDPDQNAAKLKALLKPCDSGILSAYEIATLVNSPKNNRAEVLDPLTDAR